MKLEYDPPENFADNAIREALRDARKLREIVEDVLPANLVAKLDFKQADYIKTEFILEDWRKREADILVLIPYQEGEEMKTVLICLLVEQQSKADRLMPLRVLIYAVLFWNQQWRDYVKAHPKGDSLQLTPVIPIVLHTGHQPWNTCKSLAELLAGPEALKAFAPIWNILFWDLGEKSAEQLLSAQGFFRQFLAVVLRENDSPEEFRAVVEQFVKQLEPLLKEDKMQWHQFLSLLLAWIVQRPKAEHEDLTKTLIQSQKTALARKEAKAVTNTTTESWIEYHYRRGVEATKEQVEAAQKETEAAKAAMRETLLEFLSDVGTPSQKLVDSINACEDIAKLQAAIKRAPKLTTLKGFKL